MSRNSHPHVTTTRTIKLSALLAAALLTTFSWAQQVVTEPAADQPTPTPTPAEEATPIPLETSVIPVEQVPPFSQLSPDDRSLRAGAATSTPAFDQPRRLHIVSSLLTGYDDNVDLTPNGSSSWFINPTAAVSYLFGSSRLAVTLLAGGGLTYYVDHPGGRDYDSNVYAQLSVAYRATPRLTLNFATSTSYQDQPDFSTNLGVNTRLGAFFHSDNLFSAAYQFTPRFSTVTSYDLGALEYSSSAGSLHDQLQHTFSEELRYLLFPTTTATAQYSFNFTDFANVPEDSTTHSFVFGVDQSFSPRFTASLRGGVQLRSPENGTDSTSPYAEGAIRYALQPNVPGQAYSPGFISWTNRYSIEQSDIIGSSGRQTFRTNLLFSYALTGRISTSLELSYFHGDNQDVGGGGGQDLFDIAPSIQYTITRYLSVNLGYRHSESDTGSGQNVGQVDGLSFSRNRYFAGVNITF